MTPAPQRSAAERGRPDAADRPATGTPDGRDPEERAQEQAPGLEEAEAPQGEEAPRRWLGLPPGRLRLVLQPLAILAALGLFALWVATSEITGTASALLTPAAVIGLTVEHLELTLVAAVVVLLIGIPLGVLLTRPRTRRLAGPVVLVANFGQAAPAIGLIVLLAIWLGADFGTAVVALVAYGVLPVLAGTITGLQGVDQRLVEAGRGMGMSAGAVLRRVELPMAVPVMLSGVRTALVLLVGTATLAAFINGGGLGELITTGITLDDTLLLASGAALVALLALLVDWAGRVVEEVARPHGL